MWWIILEHSPFLACLSLLSSHTTTHVSYVLALFRHESNSVKIELTSELALGIGKEWRGVTGYERASTTVHMIAHDHTQTSCLSSDLTVSGSLKRPDYPNPENVFTYIEFISIIDNHLVICLEMGWTFANFKEIQSNVRLLFESWSCDDVSITNLEVKCLKLIVAAESHASR